MPTKTLYLRADVKNSGVEHCQLQDGGTAPGAATTTTGWDAGSNAVPKSSLMDSLITRDTFAMTSTMYPTGAPDNTLGDCFRTVGVLTGTFAAGNWDIVTKFLAGQSFSPPNPARGRIRIRVWRSVNANGSGATEITSGTQVGSITTDHSTVTEMTSSLTWSAPSFTLTDEYLFLQMAWEVTTQSSTGSDDWLFRTGSGCRIITTDFSTDTTPPPAPTGLALTPYSTRIVSNWNSMTSTEGVNILDAETSDIEAGTDGWYAWVNSGPSGAITRDTSIFYGGSASLKVDWGAVTGTSNREITTGASPMVVAAGTSIVGSAYVRVPSGLQFRIVARVNDLNGNYVTNMFDDTNDTYYTGTGDWQRVVSLPKAYSTSSYRPGFLILLSSGSFTGIVHVDNAMVEIKSTTGASTWVVGNGGAGTTPDVAYYNLYRATVLEGPYTRIATNITTTTYDDTGLTNGTLYYYKISAVDTSNNEGVLSGAVSATPSATPPANPTGLAATGTRRQIALNWNANTEVDLSHYNLYRSPDSGGSPSGTWTKVNGTNITGTSYTDTSLADNTRYHYRVRAVDTDGTESGDSNTATALTYIVQRLIPDEMITQLNLSGALSNIVDDPDSPDANWLTSADPSGSSGTLSSQYAAAVAAASGIANRLSNSANAVGSSETSVASIANGTKNVDYGEYFTFGTAFANIPSNATILGITLQLKQGVSVDARQSAFWRLESSNGTAISTEQGGSLSGALPGAGVVSHSYLGWNALPTATQLKASTFGVRLRTLRTSDFSVTYSLDWVRMSVSWEVAGQIINTEVRVGFESPDNQLAEGAGWQEFRVRVRKKGTGDNPSVRIELWENGGAAALATPLSNTIVSADGVVSGLFDASLFSIPNEGGTLVESRVVGSGATGGAVEVGAVEWNATQEHAPAPVYGLALIGSVGS